MQALVAPLVAALVAAVVGHLGARLAACSGPQHAPREGRSSHREITPSGGGIGVAVGVFAALVVSASADSLWGGAGLAAPDARRLAGLAALGLAVMTLGVFDDLYDWPPRLKLALLGGASASIAWLARAPEALPLVAGLELPLWRWLGLAGATLWVFTVMNTLNFMDGANGLAGGVAGIASLGLAAAAALAGAPAAALAAGALAGALLGFLPVNAPVARVFMGDAGSLFAGAWFAGASLLFAAEAPRGAVYLPPLLLLPILGDALLTIAWHAKMRIPLMKPHLDHAYQMRIRSGETHVEVVREIWARAAVFAGLAGAAFALSAGTGEPSWTLAGLALGAGLAWRWWRADRRRASAGA